MIKLDKSLINTIEAFLLTAGRPLTVSEIRDLLNEKEESIELGKTIINTDQAQTG